MTKIDDLVVHSCSLGSHESGELLSLPCERAGWESMSFFVRRLVPGENWETGSESKETALVLLGGQCEAEWDENRKRIGRRANVFGGLPYALYLPAGHRVQLRAETELEVAACSVPSGARLTPRLVTPKEAATCLLGGGNASRQIVEVMPPEFPADKLMVREVYIPSGNWAGYPPHKHDVHKPPREVDLDEIYYFRMERPAGYAYQRLYTPDGKRDVTLTIRDGDVVLVREGYHPTVAGHGYNVYFLNFLAGSARSLANSEDPDHAWVRSTWKTVDPRLPLVQDDAA